MKKAPSTQEVEIRNNLDDLRGFTNKLQGRKTLEDDDNDDNDDQSYNFQNLNINFGNSVNNKNVDYYLKNLPDIPNFEPTNAVVEDRIMKNINNVLDGLTEERKQEIKLSSSKLKKRLQRFFSD